MRIGLDDPRLIGLVARAETTFLASVTPDGAPDVAHRGGPAGVLELDAARGTPLWPEYLGDGVFKSTGNVRATGLIALLVPDLDTGDAVAFTARARTPTCARCAQHDMTRWCGAATPVR